MNVFCPKTRFIANAAVASEHRKVVTDPGFVRSLDAALLAYQERLTALQESDIGKSSALYQRILGAREFVGMLINLAERPEIPARVDKSNLNYKA